MVISKKGVWKGKDKKEIFKLAGFVNELYQRYIFEEKEKKHELGTRKLEELINLSLKTVIAETGYARSLNQTDYVLLRGDIRKAIREIWSKEYVEAQELQELWAQEVEAKRIEFVNGAISNEKRLQGQMNNEVYGAETYDEMNPAEKKEVWSYKLPRK